MHKILHKIFTVTIISTSILLAQEFDAEKIYIDKCQSCHGFAHKGGVGSDISPSIIKKKNTNMLVETILEGKFGTTMPAFKDVFSLADALKMVTYLKNWDDVNSNNLSLKNIKNELKILNNREDFLTKYPYPTDIKDSKNIVLVAERLTSRIIFLNSLSGDILSTQNAGFAIHSISVNKRFPRYVYTISRDGLLTMFDVNTPKQQKIAEIRIGTDSRQLSISSDGKYILVGNYAPSGAVLLDAMTLEPLKVYPTSTVIDTQGNIVSSKVSSVISTPYAPYFAFALKDAGRVYIIDYSKDNFPIIADISNIGEGLNNGFVNDGNESGRYYMISSQDSNNINIIDLKTKTLISKVYTGSQSKPSIKQAVSWYNKELNKDIYASTNINTNELIIWDNEGVIIKRIRTSAPGLTVNSSDKSPYLWIDNVLGDKDSWNKIHLLDKNTLEVIKIIEVGSSEGKLVNTLSNKDTDSWSISTVKTKSGEEIIPRIIHAEPINNGLWMMISESNTGRVGIYDSKTGKFIKYIDGFSTPSFTYSIEHRLNLSGS